MKHTCIGQEHCKACHTQPECNCYQGHVEDCPNWDGTQAYRNLKSAIQSLDQLIDDQFLVTMFKDNGKYFIRVHHVEQEETFDGHDSIQDALEECDQWVTHCNEGR